MKTGPLIAIVIWSCLSVSTAFAKTAVRKSIDEETGLVIDRGFKTVKTNCTICHSAKFILRQKGDRRPGRILSDGCRRLRGFGSSMRRQKI